MTNKCFKCGKKLKPGQEVWLELSWLDNVFRDTGKITAIYSQGMWPFGPDCAPKVIGRTCRMHPKFA